MLSLLLALTLGAPPQAPPVMPEEGHRRTMPEQAPPIREEVVVISPARPFTSPVPSAIMSDTTPDMYALTPVVGLHRHSWIGTSEGGVIYTFAGDAVQVGNTEEDRRFTSPTSASGCVNGQCSFPQADALRSYETRRGLGLFRKR